MMRQKYIIAALLLLLGSALFAENLRGRIAGVIDLSQDEQTGREHELKINEFLAVVPGAKGDFLEGLQLSIRIPEGLQRYGDNYVLLFYKRVTPEIHPDIANYQGLEAGNTILPNRPRFYLELPLGGAARQPLTSPLNAQELPLLLNIISMSKALPSALEASSFLVKITPVWGNKGKVELFFSGDPVKPENIQVWLDNAVISLDGRPLLLSAGIHSIKVQVPGYREFSRSFAVNQAQTVQVEIPLARQLPALYFEAPEGTQIYLDGEKINPSPVAPLFTSEGNHTVLFILEDYKISKQFQVSGSNDYKISLFLDIFIQEY